MKDKELDDIVKDNVPRLHSFVRGRVSNRDDAEDIVQDTVYQFLRTISALENPISHVSSWLYTVAHNLIINHGKKRHEEPMPEQPSRQDTFMTDLSEIMMADDSDNPVSFEIFESDEDFIRKTEESVRTQLDFRELLADYSTLIQFGDKISRLHLSWLLHLAYKAMGKTLRKRLCSGSPSTLLLNIYKLLLFNEG